jgi:hypothetical protein
MVKWQKRKGENAMSTIEQLPFDSVTMPDLWDDNTVHSHRLTDQDLAEMPDDTKDLDTLKVRLYDLLHEKLGGYGKLELLCDIKRDTFQKTIRFKGGRNINYVFLAKFSIGAKLSEAEARELFLLMGHELSERSRCDYLLLRELRNGGTLEDYDSDMVRYGYGTVLSKAD